jgi:hypothetical protein
MPECCRGEKKGVAPFVLSSKSGATPMTPMVSVPFLTFLSPCAPLAVIAVTPIASVHGPPSVTIDLPIFLSTLRV